jgi:hypothetical protein
MASCFSWLWSCFRSSGGRTDALILDKLASEQARITGANPSSAPTLHKTAPPPLLTADASSFQKVAISKRPSAHGGAAALDKMLETDSDDADQNGDDADVGAIDDENDEEEETA